MRDRPVHTVGGMEIVRRLALASERFFTPSQARALASEVGLSPGYLGQALHHLERSGWIVRLRHGLYALAPTVFQAPPLHEYEIAMVLVSPAAISHRSAMSVHELTEQVPRQVYVLTTTEAAIPRHRSRSHTPGEAYELDGIHYRFIQVKPEHFFGTETRWVGQTAVLVTDIERTLLDGLLRPRLCGDFGEVLAAIEAALPRLDVEKMAGYARQLGPTPAHRLGYVLETLQVAPDLLESLRAAPIRGYRPLDPSSPRRGPCNSRWMIQENLSGRVAS